MVTLLQIARKALLLVAVLWAVDGFGAYGLKFDPARTNDVPDSSIVPVTADLLKMTQPDGIVRWFVRDERMPLALHGEPPWSGKIQGGVTVIRNDPAQCGGRSTEFRFENGLLRQLKLDDKVVQLSDASFAAPTNTLASLWPANNGKLTTAERKKKLDLWRTGNRLRFLHGNPNHTAALLLELALLALAGVLLRWGIACRGLSAVLTLAAVYCMFRTESRGAFVAFVMALGCLGAFALCRRFSLKRLLIGLAVAGALLGVVVLSGMGAHFTERLFVLDESNSLRISILRAFPAMLWDAPGGWGLGESGRAFVDWYQSLSSDRLLRTLVCTHLTWMVELGWCLRFLYVFLWCGLLLVLGRACLRGRSSLPFMLWLAFGVAGTFNHVGEVWELWVLPVGSLGVFLASRPWRDARIYVLPIGLAAVFSGALLGWLAWSGSRSDRVPDLSVRGDVVCVRGVSPNVVVVRDDHVLGSWAHAGREIRRYMLVNRNLGNVGFAGSIEHLPPTLDRLVLTGGSGRDYLTRWTREGFAQGLCQPQDLVFLSPPFAPREVPDALRAACRVHVVVGSLALRLTDDKSGKLPEGTVVIPGAELYLPRWLEMVLGK